MAYEIRWFQQCYACGQAGQAQSTKNYIGFQSNNASITNCAFLHIKRFKFSNLHISFLLTLCLQDHLIHRFCPSWSHNMSEHLWVKGPFLSLLQDSGTPSRLTLHYRYFIRHLHLKWPVVLQQSYVYASVNRWVFKSHLKVHVSVSSWRAGGRSFHAFGPA